MTASCLPGCDLTSRDSAADSAERRPPALQQHQRQAQREQHAHDDHGDEARKGWRSTSVTRSREAVVAPSFVTVTMTASTVAMPVIGTQVMEQSVCITPLFGTVTCRGFCPDTAQLLARPVSSTLRPLAGMSVSEMADRINNRPRKRLHYLTPTECL